MFSISFITLGFCVLYVISVENSERERVASLIVLPPIVLGYDELYDEPSPKKPAETPKEKKTLRSEGNKAPAPFKKLNLPWDQLVAYEDPTGEEAIIIPQQRLVLKRTENGGFKVQNSKDKNNTDQSTNKTEALIHKPGCKSFRREGNSTEPSAINKTEPSTKQEDVTKDVDIRTENTANVESSTQNVKPKKKEPMSKDVSDDHFSVPAQGMILDPLKGDTLNFQGKFVLPNKLFDCPCSKDKS